MSVKITSLVWQGAPDVKGNARLVLLNLADFSNDDGVCWPSIPVIAAKALISERSARYIIKQLVNLDYIRVEEHRGRTHTNTYRINLQRLQVLGPEKVQPLQVLAEIKPAKSGIKPASSSIKPAIAIAPEPYDPSIEPSIKESTQQRALPKDFCISETMRLWALGKMPLLDVDAATEQWIDYCRRKRIKSFDWEAEWHSGMRTAEKWRREAVTAAKKNGGGKHESRAEATERFWADIYTDATTGIDNSGDDRPRLRSPGPTPS